MIDTFVDACKSSLTCSLPWPGAVVQQLQCSCPGAAPLERREQSAQEANVDLQGVRRNPIEGIEPEIPSQETRWIGMGG